MEIKAVVKEITKEEIILETVEGTKINLPKILRPDAKLEQVLYLTCSDESAAQARGILNELIAKND
jgi:hypothetical protein